MYVMKGLFLHDYNGNILLVHAPQYTGSSLKPHRAVLQSKTDLLIILPCPFPNREGLLGPLWSGGASSPGASEGQGP